MNAGLSILNKIMLYSKIAIHGDFCYNKIINKQNLIESP